MAILTKFSKKDFKRVLSEYQIGDYQSHRHIPLALQNTIYILKTTKGKYVLKIFEHASEKFINFQIKIIDFLAKKNVCVTKILKAKCGKEILCHKGKKLLLQKFSEGISQKIMSELLLKDIARKMALMNKNLLKIKLEGKFVWEINHEFKTCNDAVLIANVDLVNHDKILTKDIKKLDRNKLRRSVIHGDFRDVNLLVKNQKLKTIIDWDDSHEDYLAYEIAVFSMNLFKSKKSPFPKIKVFFKEYQKYLKLAEEEKKAIYYFIKKRFLGVLFWHIRQMKIHKDLKKQLSKKVKELLNYYLVFDKISLEDFLKLIE